MFRRLSSTLLVASILILTLAAPVAAQAEPVQRFDFQPSGAQVQRGFTEVTPTSAYSARAGFGFTAPPSDAVNGARHSWAIFGRRVRVDEAIPVSVLSDATRDSVTTGLRRITTPFSFRVDVPPGSYDVTVWLGDVTRPLFQVHADVNGEPVDVERMDVLLTRGRLAVTTLNDGRTPSIGNAVPRTVRVDAPEGFIELTVGPGEHTDAITWDYVLDQCPNFPRPEARTEDMIPAYAGASLQALELRPAADPPLVAGNEPGTVALTDALDDLALVAAVAHFNAGRIAEARAAFGALDDPAQRLAKGAGLFWVAGHPATLDDERVLLAAAHAEIEAHLRDRTDDLAASHLLRQVALAADAERYRTLYGYGGTPATENLGRANAIVEHFGPDHPYDLKGQILWLRNRGGLDPRRCTMSWERAQWLAGQLDAAWGEVNPYVHLYATDEWQNDGRPWLANDWGALAGEGPEWARNMVRALNTWLDLFEWWSIHRQTTDGEIGGGWTDDVEIIPAFALTAFVLEDASHISEDASIRFADGIWNSHIIDRERGYQAQYADVEHTAEPTGYSLHMYPMLRHGDPEGMERIMKSAKTFTDLFLTTTPLGHTHFKGNHMSATQIATNPDHRGDIPLNGRAVAPLSFLLWYAENPGIAEPLEAWTRSWAEDAARTDKGKPAGVFPQYLWVPEDEIGYAGIDDWYSADSSKGQWSAFPGYQYYLYNLAANFYLRTGEDVFRAPFDALQDYALAWAAAGRPDYSSVNAPPPGEEQLWVGNKLTKVATGATFELDRSVGGDDWDPYLSRFGTSYAGFAQDPSAEKLLADNMGQLAATARDSWPYRTTEGVMTDRILLPGWFNVISYYLGADIMSFFLGLPQHAVTWEGAGRLFAAAVTESTTKSLAATTYLFADAPREVTLKLWNLEVGGEYVLEAGPADEIGAAPATVAQSVPFTLAHRGEMVSFTLPGREVYALRITQTSPGSPTPPLAADVGVAARDVTYDAAAGGVTVRVHNLGALDAADVTVALHAGPEATGAPIGTDVVAAIEAPVDLVPRHADVFFAYAPSALPSEVTVVLDAADALFEITELNNVATAVIGGRLPDYRPPMLTGLDPVVVAPGESVAITGRGFRARVIALESETPATHLTLTFVDAENLSLAVDPAAPVGTYLVSVRNVDGLQSNLLPLVVTDESVATPTPPPTPAPERPTIYLPRADRPG